MTTVLTQAEADALIRMLKESLVESINFPGKGEKRILQFKVIQQKINLIYNYIEEK